MGQGKTQDRPLRLEYVDVKTLAENPSNWRRHSRKQLGALESVIGSVGWAGALLYNERTQRLIDGHARKEVTSGEVPVLVGSWTEDEERLILATLDPLAALAETDNAALGALLADLQEQDGAVREMLEGLAEEAGLRAPSVEFPEYDESIAEGVEYLECPSCGHKWPK